MPSVHALLIGVDCYLPNRLPDGSYYPSLAGCVNDVAAVERFLRERAGVDPSRITKLTATQGDGTTPPEPKALWPTYRNIVAAWKSVTAAAAPGDQVYVHYSGHGGRSLTSWPELKGKDGLDESLVPTDIGNSEARYVRDLELMYLLQAMVEKGLLVTVVLDSCHSGGATRAQRLAPPGVAIRGIPAIDTTPRPAASDVAAPAALAALHRRPGGAPRAATAGSGWLFEPSGYVLLAACRAQESACEYTVEGTRHGALTYWLLDSLRQLGPGLSWRAVHQRVLAEVHGAFAEQTPQLQGEGDRAVLGDAASPVPPAAAVLEVRPGRIRVGLGQAHGLRTGATLSVEAAPGERLALATVDELGAAESWAALTAGPGATRVQVGARAVALDPGDVRLRRGVHLLRRDGAAAFWDAVARGLSAGTGFVKLAGDGDTADFHVTVEGGMVRICDAAAELLPNVTPVIEAAAPDAAPRVLRRLEHLARYANVRELDNRDATSPLARKLVVELAGWQEAYETTDAPAPQPFPDPTQPTVRAGTWAFLRIKNASTEVLNVTVLDLRSDWAISKAYPAHAGAFEPFDPGRELLLPLRAAIVEAGVDSVRDVMKVLATVDTTDFGLLELPSLDQASGARGPRARARPLASPLERLLAAVAGDAPSGSRALTAASSASHEWTTAQVELRVVR